MLYVYLLFIQSFSNQSHVGYSMKECYLSYLPEEALKEISRDAAGKRQSGVTPEQTLEWQSGVTPEQTLRWSSRCSDALPISCVGNIYLLHKLNSLLAFVVLY